jgi:hypothetical protein
MDEPRKPRLLTRPDVLAWAMYDWANSAYSTLSITIVVVFFSKILFPEAQWGNWSGSAFAFALAAFPRRRSTGGCSCDQTSLAPRHSTRWGWLLHWHGVRAG